MNEHKKDRDLGLGAVALVIVIVLAYAFTSGFTKSPTFNFGTTPTTTIPNGGSGNTGICPANAQAPVVQFAARNITPVTGAVTLVAAPSNITSSTTNNQTVVSSTKQTVSAYVTLSNPGCGIVYTNIVGDNLNWYQNKSSVTALPGTTVQAQPQIFQYSGATALVSNAPQNVGAANVQITGLSTGALVVSAQESVQAGRGWFGYPGEGFLVTYTYNNLAISSISLPGAITYSGTVPVTYVSGQNAQVSFIIPAIHFSQYASPSGASSGYTLFSPQIQTSSGFSGSAQVSFVGQTMEPLSNFAGVNGQWYTGAATYTVGGINGQAVGTAISPQTSASYFLQLVHS